MLQAHDVNAVNVSIRHALPDPGTYLAWAPNEVFAFVLYYKQRTDPDVAARGGALDARADRRRPSRAAAATTCRTSRSRRARSSPRRIRARRTLFAVKRRVDPTGKFTNALWDLYQPDADGSVAPMPASRLAANVPAEARIALDSDAGVRARAKASEYLTHPEWDLVYAQRGVREVARGREAAERIPVRRLGGDVLAVVRRDVQRREASATTSTSARTSCST